MSMWASDEGEEGQAWRKVSGSHASFFPFSLLCLQGVRGRGPFSSSSYVDRTSVSRDGGLFCADALATPVWEECSEGVTGAVIAPRSTG